MKHLNTFFKRVAFLAGLVLFLSSTTATVSVKGQLMSTSTEGVALMAIYTATGGATWTQNTNWGSLTEPLANWYGVTVVNNKVTRIKMEQNNMVGTLPDVFASLPDLTFLHLKKNMLTGALPASVGSLVNLTFLGINEQTAPGLTGTLPAINGLVNLIELYIQGNQFTGTFPNISALTKLAYLNLSNNQFNAFAGSFATLIKMKELRVNNNKFEFDDLIPLKGIASTTFVYAPQAKIGTPSTQTVPVGGTFSTSVTVAAGTGVNSYQWYKATATVTGATLTSFSIPVVATTDAGAFSCKIRNTKLTLLTLESEAVTLTVTGAPTNPDWYITTTGGKNVIVIDEPAVVSPAVVRADVWVETLFLSPAVHFDYVSLSPAYVSFTDGATPGADLNRLTHTASSPATRPYKYKINVTDASANTSSLSDMQQSVHLTSSIAVGAATANLLWTPYVGKTVDYYEVWGANLSPDLGNTTATSGLIATLPDGSVSFTYDPALFTPPTYYFFLIKTYFVASPDLLKGGSLKFSESNMLSLTNEANTTPVLKIYPNPVVNNATLKFDNPSNQKYTLSVMDLTGKVWKEESSITGTEFTISRGNLVPGIYFVRLTGDDYVTMNARMIVN